MSSVTESSTDVQSPTEASRSIHPDTMMGPVTLRVADLKRSLRFYQEAIGFQEVDREGDTATLSVAGVPLLVLREVPGVRPTPRRATGLYHFAILLPSQADLGRALQRLIAARVPVGQGDHLVSEALYLSDPDANGIEIYRDRPRSTWHWQNGQIRMASDPVDLQGLLDAAEREGEVASGLPAGTIMGHVHLKVGNIPQARAFYHEVLGFDVMAGNWPGALFVSAGGYHHHLGLNSWESQGAGPAIEGFAGLDGFTIVLPNTEEEARIRARLDEAGIAYTRQGGAVALHDPWQNQVVLTVEPNNG